MTFVADTGSTFTRFMNKYGSQIKMQLFSRSYSGTEYDDEHLTASGNVIDSYNGYLDNVSAKPYSDDYAFVQQGLVKLTDKKLFVPGEFPVSENAQIVVNAGSYWVKRTDKFEMSGTTIYKRIFLRSLADSET